MEEVVCLLPQGSKASNKSSHDGRHPMQVVHPAGIPLHSKQQGGQSGGRRAVRWQEMLSVSISGGIQMK